MNRVTWQANPVLVAPDRTIMMIMVQLVAIECSTATASVAILHDSHVVDRRFATDSRQSEHILRAVDDLVRASNVDSRAIDAIAVSIGPGAFTGVRLGIAAAQGLALAWNVPVIPVSTLAALACSIEPEQVGETPVLAVLDARMGELYAGWFRVHSASVMALDIERVLAAHELVRPEGVAEYSVVGQGFGVYEDAITRAIGIPQMAFADAIPQAADVVRLARRMWPDHAVPPESVEAAYLRNKVALTTVERDVIATASRASSGA